MQGKYYISKAGEIVNQGRPTKAFAQWLSRVSAIVEGVSNFLGENGDGELTADDVSQGITNRIIELANQAVARNADGTIAIITYTDINTADVILTEQFSYTATGLIDEIVGTDADGQVTAEQFTFIGDYISAITVAVT